MGGSQRRVHGWVTEEGPWVRHRGGSTGGPQGKVHWCVTGKPPARETAVNPREPTKTFSICSASPILPSNNIGDNLVHSR